MSMNLSDTLARIEADEGWRRGDAFVTRAELADRLDLWLVGTPSPADDARAQRILDEIAALDETLFARLRDEVRAGRGRAALSPWLSVDEPRGQHYDALDALLGGVLALEDPVSDDPVPPPDMVFYQPTPARHIVDCVRRAAIGAGDTVLDLGSGLGHVPMLVNILSDAQTTGVEREPAYVDAATHAARALGLTGVRFIHGDARDVSFEDVDVVYLFTPFIGRVLAEVVVSLERVATRRPLRVVTLGPCTRTFARLPWLHVDGPASTDRVAVFRTRGA